jgi:hypothetical protein
VISSAFPTKKDQKRGMDTDPDIQHQPTAREKSSAPRAWKERATMRMASGRPQLTMWYTYWKFLFLVLLSMERYRWVPMEMVQQKDEMEEVEVKALWIVHTTPLSL